MTETKKKIHYLDALAGAGKTYSLVRHAHRLARRGGKVLFVQPTKDLIDRTVADELGRLSRVRHRVIHGDTETAVVSSIVTHFKEAGIGGEIVFITHAAFLTTPYFEKGSDWTVIVDEVPQADHFAEHNIPETRDLIVPYLDVRPFDARYDIVTAKPGMTSTLRDMARNKAGDEVWDIFKGFVSRVVSPNWTVHVLANQFENLRSGEGEKRKLLSYALLQPSVFAGFQRIIIAGACFEDTLLYRLWLDVGVEFEAIKLPLRYTRHQNGHLLRILYASDEPWSKTFRNRTLGNDGETVLKKVVDAVKADVGDRPFLWMGNKDLPDGQFGLPGARRLPNTPHGLNGFQDAHITVVLSALNPPPAHFAFLGGKGVDGDQVRTSLYRTAVYQAVMRSSIRNPHDEAPKTIIVMDRETGCWLADLFPGAEVAVLPGVDIGAVRGKAGRPPVHKTPAARQAAHRRQKKIDLLIQQDIIAGSDLVLGDYPDLAAATRARMTEVAGLGGQELDTTAAGTAFASIYSAETLGHIDYGDDDSFIQSLRLVHQDTIAGKEDAGLISPAFFDSEMADGTSRGLANVRYLRGIWLDNDGGDLSHDDFARLFPRLRIVVFNTYSSTPENPRWRAFIPTTQAMSMSVHRIILDQIIHALNEEGYWSPEQLAKNTRIKRRRIHGFDLSKLTASSLFFLPAQARHPQGSFFIDHAGERRRPIEPYRWIERSIIHTNPERDIQPVTSLIGKSATFGGGPEKLRAIRESLQAQSPQRDAEAEAGFIARWRETAWQKGQGHAAFFNLAAGLRRLGVDDPELRQTLLEEAAFARSPAQRRGEIRDIIRSLKKGR